MSINAIHPECMCYNYMYPEGTTAIATVLCCLTMSANSLVNTISHTIESGAVLAIMYS